MTFQQNESILIVTSERHAINVTANTNQTDGMYEFYTLPQTVLVSILCLSIIIGNGCVLAAIWLSKNGRESRMNFFIMHLALADLLVGVMVSFTDLATKITVEWYAGNVMCKVIQFLQAMVTYSSTYMLVSLSIDRYDAVARPMNFSKSGYQARFLVYSAWIISGLFASPALFMFGETIQENKRQCWMDFPYFWHWQLFFTVVAVVTFLLPAIIIAACYIAIIYIIWSKGRCHHTRDGIVLYQGRAISSSRSIANGNCHATGRGVIPQAKVRTIKMTLSIVIVFILCWSPYCLYNLLDIYEHLPQNNRVTTLMQSAVPLNSAANPIIYGIFSTRICKNLRRTPVPACVHKLTCCCQKAKNDNRRGIRGHNHNGLTSQITDPSLTYDAHRLNEVRLSPMNQCNLSPTKNVQSKNGYGNPRRKDVGKKPLPEVIKDRLKSEANPANAYEMAPLAPTRKDTPMNLGSIERINCPITDDLIGSSSFSKRTLEVRISTVNMNQDCVRHKNI